MSGMTSLSPRKIFGGWDDKGLPAGERHIGQTSPEFAVISATVITNTAATYIDGKLAGTGGLVAFAGAARVAGGKGCVRSMMAVDRGDQGPCFNLILFNTTTVSTTLTDAAVIAIDDADVSKIVGLIACSTADYVDLGANKVVWKANQNVYFDLPSTATTLYAAVRAGATWTPTGVSDLGIQLQIEQF